MQTRKYWVGVASADHVAIGQAGSFMQVCHGKAAPLRRISPGEGVAYYSPAQVMRGSDGLQSFTAIGFARDSGPYAFDMGNGFVPSRRDVDWLPSHPAPIRPLLQDLTFTKGQRNWGYAFRFGVLQIAAADFSAIAAAMAADQAVCQPQF